MKYEDYMLSSEWRSKRDWVIKIRGGKCELCNSIKIIQVHHLTYYNLGNETGKDLLVVCKKCHEKIHKNKHPMKNYNFSETESWDGEY